MKPVGGRICLELHDLELAGFKRNTVIMAKHRNSGGWEFLPDPKDMRRVLVPLDSLSAERLALVEAVHAADITAIHRRAKTDHLTRVKALVEVHPEDLAALRAHTFGTPAKRLPTEHIHRYARACAYLRMLHTTTPATYRALGCRTATAWHKRVLECLTTEDLDLLPRSYTKLRQRVRQFMAFGVEAVVSKRFGNQNGRRITKEVNAWLVSQYALPTKPDVMKVATRYATHAKTKGWPTLSASGVYHHLFRAEVEQQWYLGRHGEAAWKAKYGHTLKNRAAAHRDSLWIGDGTKLNIYYKDKKGMDASTQMYIVIDAHAHVILGWSLGARENMPMQYAAAKMALSKAQARPLQWLYDGQSGHTSGAGEDFYDRASALHFPSQPYNPKGKPIERIIGEFQKQIMRDHWAFTGQNITAKRLDSRPNMEFIKAHKDKLPTLEELPVILGRMIDAWNNAKHAKFPCTRMEAYDRSVNPLHQPLDPMDMVELFWVRSHPIKYYKHGISVSIHELPHTFEVYDKDGHPDEAFRRLYINARFVVRYDPNELDYVCLYQQDSKGDLRFVAVAQPKVTVARAVVDLLPGERAVIDHSLELRKREVANLQAELEELQRISGVDPEMLIEMAAVGGAPKDDTNRAETCLQLPAQPVAIPAFNDDEDDDPGISPYDA